MRQALHAVVVALIITVAALVARANDESADLALVLAVDVSGSVDADEYGLQMIGYAEAFRSKEVRDAIFSGPRGVIAVSMVQWAGPFSQVQALPWILLRSDADAISFADSIMRTRRHHLRGGTSIGSCIFHSTRLFEQAPPAFRKVIDISGDGKSNSGYHVEHARDEAAAAGITINGLPIENADEPDLVEHYRSRVIGGPGAFLVVAHSFDDFARAIKQKLILEIAGEKRAYAAR